MMPIFFPTWATRRQHSKMRDKCDLFPKNPAREEIRRHPPEWHETEKASSTNPADAQGRTDSLRIGARRPARQVERAIQACYRFCAADSGEYGTYGIPNVSATAWLVSFPSYILTALASPGSSAAAACNPRWAICMT